MTMIIITTTASVTTHTFLCLIKNRVVGFFVIHWLRFLVALCLLIQILVRLIHLTFNDEGGDHKFCDNNLNFG